MFNLKNRKKKYEKQEDNNLHAIANIVSSLKYPELKVFAESIVKVIRADKDLSETRKEVKDLTPKDIVDVLHHWAETQKFISKTV